MMCRWARPTQRAMLPQFSDEARLTSKTPYSVPSQVLVAHLEGEAVLLHMDTKRYYRLNDTAAMIWKGLERGDTVSGIAESLCREFDVPADEASREVERVLTDLVERGLVVRA